MATSNIASMLAAANAKRGNAPTPKAQPQEDKLIWDNVSPDELSDDLRTMYYAISKARSAFEDAFTQLIEPEDHLRLVFSYKRGLAVALAPKAKASGGLNALIERANRG